VEIRDFRRLLLAMVIVALFITLAVSPTNKAGLYTGPPSPHFTLLTRRAILRLNMRNSMIVEPGYDARAAERVVALITKYAVRFDPVDRITFYSGIVRRLAPFGQSCKLRCAPTILSEVE
jgi:hypothetical protein